LVVGHPALQLGRALLKDIGHGGPFQSVMVDSFILYTGDPAKLQVIAGPCQARFPARIAIFFARSKSDYYAVL
ncbi:MAG: hypothetical protein ACREDP_24480, partial [Bradyrhizobium sp.]